jgi:hypothetical protein
VPFSVLVTVIAAEFPLLDKVGTLDNVIVALAKLKRVNINRTPNPKNPKDLLLLM